MTLPWLRDLRREIYDIRAALEALAARRFVEHADTSRRRRLRGAFDELERVTIAGGDTVALLTAKDRFYDVLIDGTENHTLRPVLTGLHARIRALRGRFLTSPRRPERALEEIRVIVMAIEAGDADAAARAVEAHLASAIDAGVLAQGDAETPGSWTRLPTL